MTRVRMSLPIAEWPTADRAMLEALCHRGGLFDDAGALAHLRESSMRVLVRPYGRWLEWLRLHDPAALSEPPVTRATLPRLRAWLDSQSDLRPVSRQMFYTSVLHILRSAAPDAVWSEHLRVKKSLARAAGRGDPARKAGRILSSKVLLEAALGYVSPEADLGPTALQRAKRLRDATMVALLAMMPVRHRAFTGLQLGSSLFVTADALTVALPGALTKSGALWEATVPEPAAALLRRYLDEARPFLLARSNKQHQMLWACSNGDPMSYSYVGFKIPQITLRLTGKSIPPHFFRDAAATTLARASPRAAQLICPVLGHTDTKTAERHYIHAGMIEASRNYADLIRRIKKGK